MHNAWKLDSLNNVVTLLLLRELESFTVFVSRVMTFAQIVILKHLITEYYNKEMLRLSFANIVETPRRGRVITRVMKVGCATKERCLLQLTLI